MTQPLRLRVKERGATAQQQILDAHNSLVELSIWFYAIALLVFTAKADWSIKGWVDFYFAFDKLKDCMWITLIYVVLPEKQRARLFTIVLFSYVRFIWDVVATLFKIDVNYDFIVDWLFYIVLAYTIKQTAKDLIKHVKKTLDRSP